MQTSDWADDALYFYTTYHRDLLKKTEEVKKLPLKLSFFPDDEYVYQSLLSSPLLSSIDFSLLTSTSDENPFEKFEEVRGWRPFLARIPDPIGSRLASEGRILTLLRKNVLGAVLPNKNQPSSPVSEEDQNNVMIVSRKKWAVIELIRVRSGVYDRDDVKQVLRNELGSAQTIVSNNNTPLNDPTDNDANLPVDVHNSSSAYGRHVVTKSPIPAGQTIFSAFPYCTSPLDLTDDSTCFHCCNAVQTSLFDETQEPTFSKKNSSVGQVQNLLLFCETCYTEAFVYCSAACRKRNERFHSAECGLLPKLLDFADIDIVAEFKVILVLRAALKSQSERVEYEKIRDGLQSHAEEHEESASTFVTEVKRVVDFMVMELLPRDVLGDLVRGTDAHDSEVEGECKRILEHLFYKINVNAIGLGPNGVGLFSGLPSMFNHSCLENVTHSWEGGGDITGDFDDATNNKLVFRAVEDLKTGIECNISYTDALHLPTCERTEPLKKYKYFNCHCPRCLSDDELQKKNACGEWKDVHTRQEIIGASTEGDNTEEEEDKLWRKKCELSEILFPTYFLTKGLCYEQLGLSLLRHWKDEPADKVSTNITAQREEARLAFHTALENYTVCRGKMSPFVQRMKKAQEKYFGQKEEVETETERMTYPKLFQDATPEDEEEPFNAPSAQDTHILLEVKTYESCNIQELETLACDIRKKCNKLGTGDAIALTWAPTHRVYEIGYGIQTLILSCHVQGLLMFCEEEVGIMIQENFEDVIQSVDLVL